jgi:hypothetical protein
MGPAAAQEAGFVTGSLAVRACNYARGSQIQQVSALWLTVARGHARRDYGVMSWTRGDEAMLLRYADLGWTARAAVAAVFEPDRPVHRRHARSAEYPMTRARCCALNALHSND